MAQNVYATTADMSVPPKALADMDSGYVANSLARASSIADGYLRKRYELPLRNPDGWTQSLTQAVADIATWIVMKDRGFGGSTEATKQIQGAYRDALTWLEKVSTNEVDPQFIDALGQGQVEASATGTATEKHFVGYATRPNGWDPNGGTFGGSGGGFCP